MGGTRSGGVKAAQTNKKYYGDDFYRRIGKTGGKNGHTGGFYAMTPEKRAEAGRKGGTISRKPKKPIYYVVDLQGHENVKELIESQWNKKSTFADKVMNIIRRK